MRLAICTLTPVLLSCLAGSVFAEDAFRAVTIEPPFDVVLTNSPLLMGTGGAKIVVNPDGSRLVIGVGRVDYDPQAPAAKRLAKERVARQNALRDLAAQTSPIQIVHRETVEEKSRIETVSGLEKRGEAIEQYLSVTTSNFESVIKDLPIIGKWQSAEGDVLFIAIGREFLPDAEP